MGGPEHMPLIRNIVVDFMVQDSTQNLDLKSSGTFRALSGRSRSSILHAGLALTSLNLRSSCSHDHEGVRELL